MLRDKRMKIQFFSGMRNRAALKWDFKKQKKGEREMKKARLIELGFGKFRLEMLDGLLIEEGNAVECCMAKERFGLSIEDIIDRSPKMTYRNIMNIIHPDKHNGCPKATRLSQILNSMKDRVSDFCAQYGEEILELA